MSEIEQGLLPNTRDRLNKIARLSGRDVIELEEEFWNIYNGEYLASVSLPESIKQNSAITALMNSSVSTAPTETITFIPIGHSGNKFKNPTRDLFIVEGSEMKIKRIVFKGKNVVDKALEFEHGHKYTDVRVGKYSEGDDFYFPRTARIPEAGNKDFLELLLKEKLDIPRVSGKSSDKNYYKRFPSKKRADNYYDEADWRVIQGQVQSTYVGNRKSDGVEFGVINIIDIEAVDDVEILEDGTTKIPTLTGWTDPKLVREITLNSLCDFYGAITAKENEETGEVDYSMNVYQIVVLVPGIDLSAQTAEETEEDDEEGWDVDF